jgi:8-hydroxy-5-deazaflavin:NADPH oxidoreductase
MKIAVLGTGMVGQNLAQVLAAKGHEVMIGTRDVGQALQYKKPNGFGMPGFGVWVEDKPHIHVGTYAQSISFGDLIINATNGNASIEALRMGKADLAGNKVLIDLGNKLQPLPGSMPKSLADDSHSLGEEIQSTFANLRVVKTLNTMNTYVMSDPSTVAGDSTVFVCGNDAQAKATVTSLLGEFGWKDIIDLGDIKGSRGVEMILPLWLRLLGSLGGAKPFNFKVVR